MSESPVSHLSDVRFAELQLHEQITQALDILGYTHCTPIQAKTLPLALNGKDVAGQAQTGTGKSAAFLLATLQRLLTVAPSEHRKPNQPRAIIIAPTRELAIQIDKDTRAFSQCTALKTGLVYGGVDYEKQRRKLEDGIDILIGTPGRIIDYFKQRVFDLRAIEVAVLDEADRMFDLGFIKDIRFLFRRMPKPEKRLSMMFSATLSFRVKELAYEHMNNPQSVEVESDQITADAVEERLYHVQNEEKIPLLIGILNTLDDPRVIVFVNTKRAAENVTAWLLGNGYTVGQLSGDVHQRKRQRYIDELTGGEIRVLVATDVAARGLHIPAVTHVINYDLPQNEEDYVHRIGRTARAGATGVAISFGCEEYIFSLMDIEQYIEHKIPVTPIEESLLAKPEPKAKISRPKNTKPSGQRKRKKPAENRDQQQASDGEKKPARRRRRRRKPSGEGEKTQSTSNTES